MSISHTEAKNISNKKATGAEKRVKSKFNPLTNFSFDGVLATGKAGKVTAQQVAQQAVKVEGATNLVAVNLLDMGKVCKPEQFAEIDKAIRFRNHWGKKPKDSKAKWTETPKAWRNVTSLIGQAYKAGIDLTKLDSVYGTKGLAKALAAHKAAKAGTASPAVASDKEGEKGRDAMAMSQQAGKSLDGHLANPIIAIMKVCGELELAEMEAEGEAEYIGAAQDLLEDCLSQLKLLLDISPKVIAGSKGKVKGASVATATPAH